MMMMTMKVNSPFKHDYYYHYHFWPSVEAYGVEPNLDRQICASAAEMYTV